MNFSRKMIFVVGAAFLAACGDKVTVAAPTPATPAVTKINSVEVAPASATITAGQGITFTAAVNADAGVTSTIAWTSSVSTITVSSAGVVTTTAASVTPGAAICATATAGTQSVKGCATLVVVSTPAVIPASVSINSIQVTGAVGGATVNPAAVVGGIDITLNVNPGNQTVSKVVLLVGGARTDSQTFTAAQAAALRFASDEAIAAQSTFPQIVFSVNTAKYNMTTGAPAWLNGTQAVSAQLYTTQAGTASAATASVATSLTFANVNGFHVTTTATGSNVVDGTGYRWNGNGALTVNALPVMYSGAVVGTVNAALGANTAVGSTCAGAPAANTGTSSTSPFAIAIALTAGQSPAGCTTTFPNMLALTATTAAGDNIATTTSGVLNTQTGLRWDNVAPPTAGFTAALAVNGRTGNWINDVVSLNTIVSATNVNGAVAAAVVDAGIGGAITYSPKVGTTFTLAKTGTVSANASALAASATNAGYCVIMYTADLLGNTSVSPGTGSTCALPVAASGYVLPAGGIGSVPFGVDRANPTIAYSGGLGANAMISTATFVGEFSVTVSDTGLVGNSGMQPGSPVKMQITQRIAAGNGAGTTSAKNADGTAATTAGVLASTGVNAAGNPIYTTAIAALTTDAYFTFNATAADAAGNTASVSPRTVAHDDGALVVGLVASPITVSTIGWTGSAFVNDALDIASYWFSANYATMIGVGVPAFAAAASVAPDRFAQASTAVNGFDAPSFLNTNYAVSNTVNLPLAMQVGGVLYPMSGINVNATNAGNLTVNGVSAAPPAVAPALAVFAPVGLATFPAITSSIASNNISSGVTTAATAGNPASGTLTAIATGPTATFNNPFSRVDFYAVNNGGAAGTEWRLIGSSAVSTLVDVGAVRTFSWNLSISGATLYTTLGYTATAITNVIAVGYNASGSIGMINAAAYAQNIIK